MSEHFLRLSGAGGLELYQQWQKSRPANAPFRADLMTAPFAAGVEAGQLRMGEENNDRWRIRAFAALNRKHPEAALPIGVLETLEFCQRCWWLGCSLDQGATLRAYNQKRNVVWP